MARTSLALVVLAMFACAGLAQAQLGGMGAGGQDIATIQIQFDNRGSKVEGQAKKISGALAKLFQVPASQVSFTGVTKQSTLLNHQSVATFTAVGPSLNGKSVYTNCVNTVKSGWFTKSAVEKNLKKATDSWWPGDSVKVQKATCGAPGQKQVSGRKMM